MKCVCYPVLLVCMASVALAADLLHDDFEDGDLTQAVNWEVVTPGATVEKTKEGEHILRLASGALVLTPAIEMPGEYTIRFTGGATWSAAARAVFLYQDTENYYSFSLGSEDRGLSRKRQGREEKLDTDALNKITLPHAAGASAGYKIHVKRTEHTLLIEIDKEGDGVDYDVAVEESDPAVRAAFLSDRFGFAGNPGSARGFFDDVVVAEGKIKRARQSATYYVNAERGDDGRSAGQASDAATPWKTIQHAADVATAGDTVLVAPGIYREMVVPVNRGGRDSPISFRAADADDRPVISGSSFINTGPWEKVDISDFKGETHEVYRTTIDWLPAMLYQGGTRMMVAQEPNQKNPVDPYELAFFLPLDQEASKDKLADPSFLTQKEKDYWRGATLLHYDSHPNAIGSMPIEGYDPDTHTLTMAARSSASIGNNRGRGDKYALRNHLGILDHPGEYYIDETVTPHHIYVWPYPGMKISTVAGTARPHGFDFNNGREHIVIDGFVVRDCSSSGILFSGRSGNHVTIRNCDTVFNMGSGISGRSVDNITIEKCLCRDNHQNGISFANCADMKILDCEITTNGDNGIWFGGGQPSHWNSDGILVRGCNIHHATARRRHPDNYQMHQVRNVKLENNVFVQEGEQNMWCQYSDNFTLRNNVFVGGSLGINSSIRSFIYHNVFWESSLRYDRHLDNHPQLGDYFKPQKAIIRNNVFVNSSIAWPAPELVDRFQAYTVDHNYYRIENSHSRSAWEWTGRKLSLNADTLVVSEVELPADGATIQMKASATWGHPGQLVFLYRDPNNYYSLGLGNARGVYRRMDGQVTCLFDDDKSELRLPHMGGATAVYRIESNCPDGGIRFAISRIGDGGDTNVTIDDTDPAAAALFTSGKAGAMTPPGKDGWCSIHEVELAGAGKVYRDTFDDEDIARGGIGEPTWQILRGGVSILAAGGNGVGYGDGSITAHDISTLNGVFRSLPDEHGVGFDFRPVEGSPLVDAGVDVGVSETIDEQARPQGGAPDIGPYEEE